jgi:carboxyl-terminal processing protease
MRRSSRLRTVVFVLALPLSAGAFLLQSRDTRDSVRLFSQVFDLVATTFVDTVASGDLYERAARGLLEQINDPYAALYSPKQLQEFTASTGGRYGGIGMLVEEQEGQTVVSRIFPNTPAAEAGVMEGDRIVQVDSTSTVGWRMDRVTELLKGVPGTSVQVAFSRPNVPDPIEMRLTRAVIRIPAVPYAIMLDGDIGYVPLNQFNETSAAETRAAIARLHGEGAKGFILDLRGNGGGIVDQALRISELFLQPGQEIMSTRGRNAPEHFFAREKPIVPTTPLVVLTDGGSASASEIVAGALQDHDRALVVGTTSFGKGLEQSLYRLDGGYALKLTTAKWFTPSGRSIHRDRVLVDGRLVDVMPDSMETDSVKHSRPKYQSDAGRIVYGGGGITPDLIVRQDTLTTAEQQFLRALTPKSQQVYLSLYRYAFELKDGVTPNFTATRAWRDEFYRRLTQEAHVELDRATFDSAAPYVNELLENRVARFAFGDSTARRRQVAQDAQLRRALEVLQTGRSQRELFAVARGEPRE